MSDATYARCTEPTGSNARDGCGWTGEVERVNELCPVCHGDTVKAIYGATTGKRVGTRVCPRCNGTGKVTHDGEGRWPFDIDKCPDCGGTIEVDK